MAERRIAAPKNADELLERLTTPQRGATYALFESKQKALMFAAAYAHSLNLKDTSKNRDASTAIRWEVFEKQRDDGFIDALGVHVSGDLKSLSEDRSGEAATLFEEFAAAGLVELQRVTENAREPLDALIDLVLLQRSESDANVPGIDPSVLQRMMQQFQ